MSSYTQSNTSDLSFWFSLMVRIFSISLGGKRCGDTTYGIGIGSCTLLHELDVVEKEAVEEVDATDARSSRSLVSTGSVSGMLVSSADSSICNVLKRNNNSTGTVNINRIIW